MIQLVIPTIDFKDKALAYRQEHFDAGENTINGSEMLDRTENYEEWLQAVVRNADLKTVSPSWVLTDTFFAIEDDTNEIVGIIDFRHTLNDFLKNFGHCGYSVRPSKRNRGYATEMLKQIITIARNAGLTELQLSVERSNAPSIRTIIKNGGVYNRSFDFEGEKADIYFINNGAI